jgi:superfamily II DNA or RNA helicase
MLTIKVGAKAEFDYPKDPAIMDYVNKALKDMAYSNPKFEDTQRLGFSTFGIPREIKTYEIVPGDPSIVRFSRGELHRFLKAPFEVKIIETCDTPIHLPNITYENTEFDLDERQERCVQAILNKKQGIIHAATSAGKSAILMRAIAERKVRTIIVIHRKILLEQLLTDARKWLRNCTIGVLQNTSRREREELPDIVFTIDKTLALALRQNPTQISGVGLIIQDEAHLAATSTFQNIIGSSPIRFRYGLTGTVKRKDRMQFLLFATFGPVIATVSKDELEEAGRTTPIEYIVHETTEEAPEEYFSFSSTKQWQALDGYVHKSETRRKQTITITQDILKSGKRKVLIVVRYVEAAEELNNLLKEAGIKSDLVTGKQKNNTQTCEDLEEGKIEVIVATVGVVSTGVNIKSLTDLVLFSPIFSNELLLHQLRGRCMRLSEGKDTAYMHLMYDGNIWPGRIARVLAILKR